MDWKKFEIKKLNTPTEVVLDVISGFSEATNNLLKLTLVKKSEVELLNSKYSANFSDDLVLHSQFMRAYKYIVFELFYNVQLYPCALKIEYGIKAELNISDSLVQIENEENLRHTLELIFKTSKFTEIVSGLMKIASLEKTEDDDLPF
ncbi:hypothetical protein [Epilithonimonas zeae]|uniref:hypothetical protein n=1 Tax=Epilithonimonas zeae TaxID=1416779 RepID=UPI00200DDA49|nr:hypothetical protein [Epilithonimonas zeae]UQB67619.1 hypothetical protein KI430_11290 [Epilithonimonas zeae]